MKLYFQYSDGTLELVKKNVTEANVMKYIQEDLKKRNPLFVSYYTRTWTDDDGITWFDVGSHVEYYLLKED